jgi:hypothetical protein
LKSIKQIAGNYQNTWFLTTRMGTKMNDPIQPANVFSLEFYEHVPWFLKGVLAAKFSKSNNFVIHGPIVSGSIVFNMLTNFYYAGLRYVNPLANLTLIGHGTFGGDAEAIVNVSIQIVPDYEIFAHYGSQTYYTGNLTKFGKYEMANVLSVNSPSVDYNVLTNNSTTLAFNVLNMAKKWQEFIIDGSNGKDLTRRYDIILLGYLRLSEIGRFVPKNTVNHVKSLEKKYLENGSKLFCEKFIYQIMRETCQIQNGCVDSTLFIEGTLLHPRINIFYF